MSNRNESYLATSRTRLGPDFWNEVIRDIAARISTLEGIQPQVEGLVEFTKQLAVQRVNEALATYVTMIEGIAEIGALSTVLATGEASIGPGEKTLFVRLSDRDLISNAGYVVVRPEGDTAVKMSGPISGYSSETGELRFVVANAVGDGADNTWVVAYAKTVVEGPVGPAPAHEWDGTELRFKNPDGSWGEAVDTKGDQGPPGAVTEESLADVISEADAKALPELADLLTIVDSATGTLKSATGDSFLGMFVAYLGAIFMGQSSKSAPTPDDYFMIIDDADENKAKRVELNRIIATTSNFLFKTTGIKFLTAENTWEAAEPTALSNTTTISWDMSTGLNFAVTITANRTLGNPSNVKPGQCGFVRVTASGGTRTLAKSSNVKSAEAVTWPIEIPSGQHAYVFYAAYDSSNVIISGVIINPA